MSERPGYPVALLLIRPHKLEGLSKMFLHSSKFNESFFSFRSLRKGRVEYVAPSSSQTSNAQTFSRLLKSSAHQAWHTPISSPLFYWTSTRNFLFAQLISLLQASLVAQMVKNLPAMWETWVQSLGQEDPLEESWQPNSSVLAWEIPWTEEPGRFLATVHGGAKSQTWLRD